MICADRVVIVTGAGRGIGRAHALAFGAAGARVLVNDDDFTVGHHVVHVTLEEEMRLQRCVHMMQKIQIAGMPPPNTRNERCATPAAHLLLR